MPYSVARQTGEIGICMALGAQRGAVVWMVLRRVLVLAGVGLAIIVPAALSALQLVKSFLFETQPNDPGTLALAGVVLLCGVSKNTETRLRTLLLYNCPAEVFLFSAKIMLKKDACSGMNNKPGRLIAAIVSTLFVPALLLADQDGGGGRDFSVTFAGCTEAIGFGPIPAAQAQPFVPTGFVLAPVGPGSAGLVVRSANCQSMTVDGKQEGPGSVAQNGLAIIPPDGTGDVNNYTVVYVTNSERLAQRLRRAGLPATSDDGLLYEFTRGVPINTGEIYAAAEPNKQPAFFLNGTVSDPVPPSFPFTANWWYKDGNKRVKMSTVIGQLRYGTAQLRVGTGRLSTLGSLIGGNSFSNFSLFSARGEFVAGTMLTTVQ